MATKTTTTAAKKTTSKAAPKAAAKTAAKKATKAPTAAPAKAARATGAKAPVKASTVATKPATKAGRKAPAAAPAATRAPREDSAQARVVAMMQAPGGASLEDIMAATSWQAHTVRGFISGTAKKKLGLTIESVRVDGKRIYKVAA
ncbi:DUF3489 domain-containing protein [Paraburkholderia sp. 35.1]|uniref:DUF3489 domain-containing protein n=1 Tax=Paraburkholderia sp. 35.1 TaxID=2991058 RepID=UPI003D1E0E32